MVDEISNFKEWWLWVRDPADHRNRRITGKSPIFKGNIILLNNALKIIKMLYNYSAVAHLARRASSFFPIFEWTSRWFTRNLGARYPIVSERSAVGKKRSQPIIRASSSLVQQPLFLPLFTPQIAHFVSHSNRVFRSLFSAISVASGEPITID